MVFMELKPAFHFHPLLDKVQVIAVGHLHELVNFIHGEQYFAVFFVHIRALFFDILHDRKEEANVLFEPFFIFRIEFHDLKEGNIDFLVLRKLFL